jgi:hypothetical protein
MAPEATSTQRPKGNYVRWNDPGVESGAGPDEIARQINESQSRVADAHHHAFSGTHVKTHGIVKGELEVGIL